MRVLVGLAVLVLLFSIVPASAEEKARGPYDRVAPGKPPTTDSKVYTNADLAKLVGIAEEADREDAADGAPATEKTDDGKAEPGKPATEAPDPLAWLQQRQATENERRTAVAEAEAALVAARQRVADLEKQMLATRNPFAARPQLSDEEKAQREKSTETAAERSERTKGMVAEAREAVRAAEAELARVRAGRP